MDVTLLAHAIRIQNQRSFDGIGSQADETHDDDRRDQKDVHWRRSDHVFNLAALHDVGNLPQNQVGVVDRSLRAWKNTVWLEQTTKTKTIRPVGAIEVAPLAASELKTCQ